MSSNRQSYPAPFMPLLLHRHIRVLYRSAFTIEVIAFMVQRLQYHVNHHYVKSVLDSTRNVSSNFSFFFYNFKFRNIVKVYLCTYVLDVIMPLIRFRAIKHVATFFIFTYRYSIYVYILGSCSDDNVSSTSKGSNLHIS